MRTRAEQRLNDWPMGDHVDMNVGSGSSVTEAASAPANDVPWVTASPPSEHRSPVVFYFGLLLVFVKFSMLHEILATELDTNFYILYVLGVPAILGALFTGGVKRALKFSVARYWAFFGIWMFLSVPFSSWPGGSAVFVRAYLTTDFPIMFVIAGLTRTRREWRLMMLAVASAACVNLISSRTYAVQIADRMTVSLGTLANANDFAGYLLLVLPVLVWVVITSRSKLLKAVLLLGVGYGLYYSLASGSRGAGIAVVIDLVVLFFSAPKRRRFTIVAVATVLVGVSVVALPTATWQRLVTFSGSQSDTHQEAVDSQQGREYLLRKSIQFTFEHPLFGVGVGQFSNYEGGTSRQQGQRGSWHDAHNSYFAAGAELGIPGFLFYLAATIGTFTLLNRAYKRVRDDVANKSLISGIFCLRLGLAGYCAATFFLNFTYYFYLPAMAGLAIATWSAANEAPPPAAGKTVADHPALQGGEDRTLQSLDDADIEME